MNRRNFLLALGSSALTAGLVACNGTGVPKNPATTPGSQQVALTVGLTYTPDIQFAPFYLAAEKGYFTREGLAITLRHHGANESLLGALQAGQEQIVYAGGAEIMQSRSQGAAVVDFATLYQQYPVVLIVGEDSPIRSAADLRGHSVGVPGPYGETWFGLLALLKQAGLQQSDVTVTNIGYTQQAALTSKKVDAVMGYSNNDVVRLSAAGLAVRTIPLSAGNPPLVGAGLGVGEETLAKNEAALGALIEAVRSAVTDLVADPRAAVQAATKYVPTLSQQTQRDAALATLKATIPLFGDPAQLGHQNPEQWQSMANFMDTMGLLAKPVTAAECFRQLG